MFVVLVFAAFYSVWSDVSLVRGIAWALAVCFLLFIATPRVRQWMDGRGQSGGHAPRSTAGDR